MKTKPRKGNVVISTEHIAQSILIIRGQKVMLSTHLAALYEVEPRTLIQAVKRNIARFPADFMFQLSWEEVENLKSQFVILKQGLNIKYPPYAFTEQGVAMLSSVLRSDRAIHVNIEIMRAFVQLRQLLSSNAELAAQGRANVAGGTTPRATARQYESRKEVRCAVQGGIQCYQGVDDTAGTKKEAAYRICTVA